MKIINMGSGGKGMDKLEKVIEDTAWNVCSEVDWSRVEDTMHHLQWYWFDDTEQTPKAGGLMRHAVGVATKALEESIDKNGCTVGSGGVMATANWVGDKPYLKVWFEVSSWDNYD
jgi:hypothetical protein